MVRECQEESGIRPTEFHKAAEILFHNTGEESRNSEIFLCGYVCTNWDGEFQETAEMYTPQAYPVDDLPKAKMWPADALWLPKMLPDRALRGEIWLAANKNLIAYRLETVLGFDA
jgi:hypothetical protein